MDGEMAGESPDNGTPNPDYRGENPPFPPSGPGPELVRSYLNYTTICFQMSFVTILYIAVH